MNTNFKEEMKTKELKNNASNSKTEIKKIDKEKIEKLLKLSPLPFPLI